MLNEFYRCLLLGQGVSGHDYQAARPGPTLHPLYYIMVWWCWREGFYTLPINSLSPSFDIQRLARSLAPLQDIPVWVLNLTCLFGWCCRNTAGAMWCALTGTLCTHGSNIHLHINLYYTLSSLPGHTSSTGWRIQAHRAGTGKLHFRDGKVLSVKT